MVIYQKFITIKNIDELIAAAKKDNLYEKNRFNIMFKSLYSNACHIFNKDALTNMFEGSIERELYYRLNNLKGIY